MKRKNVEDMTLAEYEKYQERYERLCPDCGSYFLTHSTQRTLCHECAASRYKAKKAREKK